jgi:anaerobic selenocysteine-containing dehydrogenase
MDFSMWGNPFATNNADVVHPVPALNNADVVHIDVFHTAHINAATPPMPPLSMWNGKWQRLKRTRKTRVSKAGTKTKPKGGQLHKEIMSKTASELLAYIHSTLKCGPEEYNYEDNVGQKMQCELCLWKKEKKEKKPSYHSLFCKKCLYYMATKEHVRMQKLKAPVFKREKFGGGYGVKEMMDMFGKLPRPLRCGTTMSHTVGASRAENRLPLCFDMLFHYALIHTRLKKLICILIPSSKIREQE